MNLRTNNLESITHSPAHPVTLSQAPYDRQPNEPSRWFARFEIFRSLGPNRTLDGAFRIAAQSDGLHGRRPGSAWHNAVRKWNWQERAEAWDTETLQHLRQIEAGRSIATRERRLDMIDRLLRHTYEILSTIDLRRLTRDKALEHLPQLRLLFRDLVAAQRSEFGHPDLEPDAERIVFHPEDFTKAMAELDEWRAASHSQYAPHASSNTGNPTTAEPTFDRAAQRGG